MNLEFAESLRANSPPSEVGQPGESEYVIPESVRIVGNRYLLIEKIGTGPLGDVYQAIDQQLSKAVRYEQRVSIELFALPDRNVKLGHRFATKFAELAKITHPNIGRAVDFGIDGNTVFLTREFLEGASLRSIMDGNTSEAFSENEVQLIVGSVANALAFVHNKGFAHPNLSANSIFVTSNYDVKIVDFVSDALSQLMAEFTERRVGMSQSLRAVDDVYALAKISFEMLTNERVDEGVSPSESTRVEQRLRQFRGIGRQRRKALLQALAVQRDERTATIAEFSRDFGVSVDEVPQRDETRKQKTTKGAGKLLVVVLAVTAAATLTWQNFEYLSAEFAAWQESISQRGLPNASVSGESDSAATPDTESVATITTSVEVPTVTSPESASVATEFGATRSLDSDSTIPGELEALGEAAAIDIIDQSNEISNPQVAANSELTEGILANAIEPPATEPAQELPEQSSVQLASQMPTQAPAQTDASVSQLTGVRYPVNVESEVTSSDVTETMVASIEPARIVFGQESTVVNESQSMATILIRRDGNLDQATSVIWWTGDNTANADLDYAELGAKIETIGAGQESITVYVPIVSDTVSEGQESFFVYANSDAAAKSAAEQLEVIIVDDDI